MRIVIGLLIAAIFLFSGCGTERSASDLGADSAKTTKAVPQNDSLAKSVSPSMQTVSLNQADSANAASQAIERKIIRNCNVTIEVASPGDSQRKVSSIAESHGGFVVTSEMSQQALQDKSKPQMTVSLVVRVPASQFDQVLQEIFALGTRIQDKTTGEDVTEEFIDLEARIRNQKALEAQFLDIMKRAGKIDDALEVQRQIAEVRTEIEKLEGRKRFLENQSALSTINVTLQTPTSIVNTAGFSYNVRSAFGDGVDVAAAIVLFLIRAAIGLLPIVVLIVLPAVLIARIVVRRTRRQRSEGAAAAAG